MVKGKLTMKKSKMVKRGGTKCSFKAGKKSSSYKVGGVLFSRKKQGGKSCSNKGGMSHKKRGGMSHKKRGGMSHKKHNGAMSRAGSKKKKKKASKKAPKKGSYIKFMSCEIKKVKKDNPKMTHKAAFKKAASNWSK